MPNSSKTVYVTQTYDSEGLSACAEHSVRSCFYNVRETGHIYYKRHSLSATRCWLVTQTGVGKTLATLPYAHSHPVKFLLIQVLMLFDDIIPTPLFIQSETSGVT